MATDPDYCEIITIGVKEAGKPGIQMNLEEFAAWLKIKDENGATKLNQKMITFNGKQFDIPVIIRAGLKAGIDLPYMELKNMTDKYKAQNHIDLMQELSVGYANYKSLDKYAQIYLGVSKKPIDFATATDDEIKAHNLEDLDLTAQLFNKFRPLFVWDHAKVPADVRLATEKETTL